MSRARKFAAMLIGGIATVIACAGCGGCYQHEYVAAVIKGVTYCKPDPGWNCQRGWLAHNVCAINGGPPWRVR